MVKKKAEKNHVSKYERRTFILSKKLKKKLKDPILIEGLPGIGFVGKLAAEYIAKELKGKKIAELYSYYFPHQVMMKKNGLIRMLKYRMYLESTKTKDLIILVGDLQPMSSEAQYEIAVEVIKYFKRLGGKFIITLGGYSTGIPVTNVRVLGAATHKQVVEEYSKKGIIFGESKGAILGAAGLFLGIGKIMGLKGICLMGETHGAYIDAQSAKAVLEKLKEILKLDLDLSKIEQTAKETEKIIKKIEADIAKEKEELTKQSGELSYIR
ncbi:MAG: proteasome assembly chaperone family protein [Candidatus Micrarchaeota archaeon]|nr:proteasome assembly chaperone family protein [Candidatus Micrarchaeota archaeon]